MPEDFLDVSRYLLNNIPEDSMRMRWIHSVDLLPLQSLLYLVDWRHAVEFGETMTGISWRHGLFGPTPDAETGKRLDCFLNVWREEKRTTFFKYILSFFSDKEKKESDNIPKNKILSIQHILKIFKDYEEDKDINIPKLVFSTYPIFNTGSYNVGQEIDLLSKAIEYKNKRGT
jgi:hypothetical protein